MHLTALYFRHFQYFCISSAMCIFIQYEFYGRLIYLCIDILKFGR